LGKALVFGLFAALVLGSACHIGPGTNGGPTGKPDPAFSGTAPQDALVEQSVAGTYGGKLVLGTPSNPKSFNPITQIEFSTSWVTNNVIYKALVAYDNAEQQFVPALAESWETTPDGLTWTFHLRKGVQWSDGEPFDADDVVFTFDTIFDPNVASSIQSEGVQSDGSNPTIEKLDDYDVRFHLKEVNALFLGFVLDGYLIPRHKWETAYKEGNFKQILLANTKPDVVVGLGPYRLVSFTPDERIVYERNPYYWKVDKDGKRLPYLDRVFFLIVPNNNPWALKMVNGEIDMIQNMQANIVEQVEQGESKGDFKVYDLGPSMDTAYLVFNQDLGKDDNGKPFVDPIKVKWFRETKFRQAVSSAIDREGMIRTVLNGRGIALYGFETPSNKEWYNESTQPKRPYDPEKARELLKEIGIMDRNGDGKVSDAEGHPIKFRLTVSSSNDIRVNMGNFIRDNLAKVGIEVTLEPVEFNILQTKLLNTRDFDGAIGNWQAGVPPDPVEDKNSILPSGISYYAFPRQKQPSTDWEKKLSDLILASSNTLDLPTRQKFFWEAMQIWSEQLPEIDLMTPKLFVAAKNRIGNLKPSVLATFTYWNIDELYLKY
jgi:peptide/nickel transport system substrate-binding protein